MAKAKSIDTLVDEQIAVLEHEASGGGSKAFGLPSWLPIPSWLVAQAIAIVFSLVKGLAKSEASKALFKSVVLKVYTAIRESYAGDPDFE